MRPTTARPGFAGLVVIATVLATFSVAGAQSRHGTTKSAEALPSPGAVARGRYVTTVHLDGGTLTVTPPPSPARPRISEAAALTAFTSDAQLLGYHRVVFGFGVATIRLRAHGVGPVTRLPAWVGFAKSAESFHCPAFTGPSTSEVPVPASNGYAAVVVGSADGTPAVTYVARSAPCHAVAPSSVTNASRSVSIPWRAAGPINNGSVRLEATVPPCGTFTSISSVGSSSSVTITLTAVVPDVRRHCHGSSSVRETVTLPPMFTGHSAIRHGRLGPTDVVRAA